MCTSKGWFEANKKTNPLNRNDDEPLRILWLMELGLWSYCIQSWAKMCFLFFSQPDQTFTMKSQIYIFLLTMLKRVKSKEQSSSPISKKSMAPGEKPGLLVSFGGEVFGDETINPTLNTSPYHNSRQEECHHRNKSSCVSIYLPKFTIDTKNYGLERV